MANTDITPTRAALAGVPPAPEAAERRLGAIPQFEVGQDVADVRERVFSLTHNSAAISWFCSPCVRR